MSKNNFEILTEVYSGTSIGERIKKREQVISDYLNDSKGRKLKTDAQGYAEVTIRSSGLNVIKASHAVARKDRTEADEDGYAATLAFALPHSDD